MKANLFLSFLLVSFTGCQNAQHEAVSAPPATPAPVAPLVAPLAARIPEVVKTYTLGAYVDPDDPTLRHEAHTVQRIVSPAHWNLAPSVQKPAGAQVDRIPAANSPSPVAVPPSATAVAQATAATEPAAETEPAISPNAAGLIDLTAPLGNESAEVNPFAVRKVPADSIREIALQLTGIVMGAKPCAVLNDTVVEAGSVIEGLTVRRIEPGAVVLQCGERRLRLPLSDQPARVRMAF